MNKIYNMRKFLLFTAVAVGLMGCSQKESFETEQTETRKYHTVSLNMQPEVTRFEVTEEPISKTTTSDTNDLYVVSIYSKPVSGGSYEKYAYGFFNKKENMTVHLLEGYLYRFEVSLVKKYLEIAEYDEYEDYQLWWEDSDYYHSLDNKMHVLFNFLYINDYNSNYIRSFPDALRVPLSVFSRDRAVDAYMGSSASLDCIRHNADRYCGILNDYTPQENGTVEINLLRMVFGARVEVTGLTHGQLDFHVEGSPERVTIQADSVCSPEVIYQFTNFGGAINGTSNTESATVRITWTSEDGARTLAIFNGEIEFERLKRTVFKITLKEGEVTEESVSVKAEEATITDGVTEEITGSMNGSESEIIPNT